MKKLINHCVMLLLLAGVPAFASVSDDQIRRLSLQHQLDANAPLISATWVGTHNSYNNEDKGYALPNNKVSMINQLNAGFRILNYDLHYAYGDIRLCHSSFGSELCGPGDTPLGNALDRLRNWLRAHPNEVVMIGVEDQIKKNLFVNTHNLAADKIERKLKDFIYAPKWHRPADAGKCQVLPVEELTKQDVLDAGKQVIIASFTGCKNTSDRYQKWVWHLKIEAYIGNKGPNADDLNHDKKLSSVYEDRVFGSGPVDTLSDNQVKTSLNKGANIIALDFGVKINRHPGAIWSWGLSEPNGGTQEDCASVNTHGNWSDNACDTSFAYACQNMADGQWAVTTTQGSWFNGFSACEALSGNHIFAAPTNAQENNRLTQVNSHRVWVNASDLSSEGLWDIHNFRYEGLQDGNALAFSMHRYSRAANKKEFRVFYEFSNPPSTIPSIFLSAPSTRDADPGILVISDINKERAKVQFVEWDYQNNKHDKEDFDLLAVNNGVYRMSDHSIWEIGQFKIHETKTLLNVKFKNNFERSPYLFLTIQGPKRDDRVIVRADKLTVEGFEAALYEQEKSSDGHGDITVSYLAIMPPSGKTRSSISTASGDVDYTLRAIETNHHWRSGGRYHYFLQEEKSRDSEIVHINERVHILTFGDIELAQIVTLRGPDTVSLRRR